tara:strand:- start:78 stop:485 length:408 start_codon:yes stop_codon:yes gene_type:complete
MFSFMQGNENLLLLLGIVSVVGFFVTLAVIPWILLRIPADYFSTPRRESIVSSKAHPSVRILVLIVKNLFGVAIVLLGIAMLILPGQGLLTILIGAILIDFPGKYRFQRWLLSRQPVLKSANWLRKKGDKEPLSI